MIRYKMTKKMARTLLDDKKIKGYPQDKLCAIVDSYFGLKEKCSEVVVY